MAKYGSIHSYAEKGSVKLKNRLFSILSVCLVIVLAFSIFSTVAVFATDDVSESNTTSETQSDAANTSKDTLVDTEEVMGMSLGEKLWFGLQVAAIGMLMVFAVLILLWAIIALMAKIFGSVSKKEEPKTVSAPVVASASEADESEIVAVATAAIAASRGESNCAFKVVSIQKIEK